MLHVQRDGDGLPAVYKPSSDVNKTTHPSQDTSELPESLTASRSGAYTQLLCLPSSLMAGGPPADADQGGKQGWAVDGCGCGHRAKREHGEDRCAQDGGD